MESYKPNGWWSPGTGRALQARRSRPVEKRQKLACVYYEEEPGRRSATKILTKDEARRIAANELPFTERQPAHRWHHGNGCRIALSVKLRISMDYQNAGLLSLILAYIHKS